MSETTPVTPNVMPGAQSAEPAETAEPQEVTPKETAQTEKSEGLTSEERAELVRLREVHQDEQKWRRVATKNATDAKKLQNLIEQIAPDSGESEFDPQAEFQRLRDEVEQERTARIREEVARTEGVKPKILKGATEEEMRAEAAEYKADRDADVQAELQKLSKGRAPAAAPSGDVTSNGKVAGPKQITSPDQLKSMTRQERIEAHKAGLLDDLMSGKAT